jgi:hypothetical protein
VKLRSLFETEAQEKATMNTQLGLAARDGIPVVDITMWVRCSLLEKSRTKSCECRKRE